MAETFNGSKCRSCTKTLRYKSNGKCVACSKKNYMKFLERKRARESGLTPEILMAQWAKVALLRG